MDAPFRRLTPPAGDTIAFGPTGIVTPDHPIIPFIRGDGIGPEIWSAARAVADAAVNCAYDRRRSIAWFEIFAGESAVARYGAGETLPADTLAALREAKEKGALALGIVNAVGSTIARETDAGVYIHAGPPRSVSRGEKERAVETVCRDFVGRGQLLGLTIQDMLDGLQRMKERA